MGKIMSICTTEQKHPDFGKLNVQWYYWKHELDYESIGIGEFEKESIADSELFLTNHTDKVWVQSINGKIEIHDLESFDSMSIVPSNAYLCRAEYDHIKKKLKPPFEKWGGRSCSCNRPTNPMQ
jgi:hypothetical protein